MYTKIVPEFINKRVSYCQVICETIYEIIIEILKSIKKFIEISSQMIMLSICVAFIIAINPITLYNCNIVQNIFNNAWR